MGRVCVTFGEVFKSQCKRLIRFPLLCSKAGNVPDRGHSVSLGTRTKTEWTEAIANLQWMCHMNEKCTCVAVRH